MTGLDSWRTGISFVEPGRIVIRGHELGDLIGSLTFGELVYLLLTARYPTPAQGRTADAVLVALADHGVSAPSTLAARIAASTGTPLQASVAAGIAAVGDHHGGALEGAMELLDSIRADGDDDDTLRAGVDRELALLRERGARVPGFGHPFHYPDPRAVALEQVVNDAGVAGSASRALELTIEALARGDRPLLPNADGAAAAALLDAGIDAGVGRAFFLLARTAGLVAHSLEERERERPFRVASPEQVTYDGPRLDEGVGEPTAS